MLTIEAARNTERGTVGTKGKGKAETAIGRRRLRYGDECIDKEDTYVFRVFVLSVK